MKNILKITVIIAGALCITGLPNPAQAQGLGLYLGEYPVIPETTTKYRRGRSTEDSLGLSSRSMHFGSGVLIDFSSQSNLYYYLQEWNIRNEKVNLQILKELQMLNQKK